MANLYTAHKDEWKGLSDIDYFGMYVKAYIPFNAWMNVSFQGLKTDREKINEIKRNINPFRNKICSLLESPSQEGVRFRNMLGELNDSLENHYIHNQERRITFTEIVLESNRSNISENSIRGIGYRVQYGNTSRSNTQTETLIKKRDGSAIIHITQSDYNYQEFLDKQEIKDLQTDRAQVIIQCYKEVAPFVTVSLIEPNPNDKEPYNHYLCGSYKLIKDTDKICKGLIEILYMLRNSLFHGELIPDKGANEVYGNAYSILKILIESI